MPEYWTFILFGVCLCILFGLFYYYVNRQLQGFQSAQQSIHQHLLYQDKVLERHDQLLSQTLGVPRSFTASSSVGAPPSTSSTSASSPAPQEAFAPTPMPTPVGVTMDTNPFSTVAALGPMVGTILNMFQSMPAEDQDDELVVEADLSAGEKLTKEELQKELSKELEELQEATPPPSKHKEGRVEVEVEEET